MKRFKDYKLRTKMTVMVAVVLVLTAAANGVLIKRMRVLRNEINQLSTRHLPSAVAIGNIDSYASDFRIAQLQLAFADDDPAKQQLRMVMVDLIERIEKNQDDFEPLIETPEERALYERFLDLWSAYIDLGYDFLALSKENEHQAALELLNGEAQEVFDNIGATLEQLVHVNELASFAAVQLAEETYNRSKRASTLTLIVAFAIAAAFATALLRLITTPVKQLITAARRVTEGDIDGELDVMAKDEIGDLSASFNAMTASLRDARDRIEAQQYSLEVANVELESKNSDLEDALMQLRDAQQQLVMREKMASLGNLVAGVAHEINNPVGAVKSAADTTARSISLINRSLEEHERVDELQGNERFQTALDILQTNNDITVTASDRIAEIVRSLKSFARLDEAEFQKADLHEGLDSTLTLLHHRFKNRITVDKRYGDLPAVECYPNQLNQVFMNLLSNAEQAIDGEGTITVATERRDNEVVVTIGDDGKGIQAEELKRIFDPGFTTKGVGVGTGLGLSISYNIVEKHRGRIAAKSDPGGGTQITITLPIGQAAG